MPRSTCAAFFELNVLIANDLDTVAPGIEELEEGARRDVDGHLLERAPRRLLVVDNQSNVALVVRRLVTSLRVRPESL